MAVILILFLLPAYGRKKEFESSYNISHIVNYSSYPVVYKGGTPKIIVDAPDADIDNIKFEIIGKTLEIRNSGKAKNGGGIKIYVTGEDIGKFCIYGSGDILSEDIDGTGVRLQNYGSGSIYVKNLDCTVLYLDLYGIGDIIIDNSDCTSAVTVNNGSGDVVLKDVDSTTLELIQQGSGSIKVSNLNATTVKATLNGTGDIDIAGDSTTAVLMVNGMGNINAGHLKTAKTTRINNW